VISNSKEYALKHKQDITAARKPSWGLDLMLLVVLLTVAVAYSSVLAVKLCNAPTIQPAHLLPFGFYVIALIITRVTLRISRFSGDNGLVAGVFLLAGIGMVMQLRMGAYASGLQDLLPFALGVIGFLVVLLLAGKGRAGALEHMGWPFYIAALGLIGVVVVFGQRFRGGLFLPGNYNPTEMAKPLLVIFLARFLCRRSAAFSDVRFGIPNPPVFSLLTLLFLWIIPLAMLVHMGDLGQALLMNGVLVVMLYSVARRTGWLVVGLLAVVACAIAGSYLSAHAQIRFAIWRNPFVDPTGKGWQVLQALVALFAGGMWGCGIGTGAPSAVPIVSSDFIYAALGEEIGWAGCILVLLAFGMICCRGWRAAASSPKPFTMLLGAGLTSCLAIQMLFNVAGVTKALPLTGLTLPFISHGGSSLVTSFIIAGFLAAISERQDHT